MTQLMMMLMRRCRLLRMRRRLHAILTLTSLCVIIYVGKQGLSVTDSAATSYGACADEFVHFRSDTPVIWIGGVPRSGTTLLRVALDAHPDIHCGAESRVIPRMLSVHQALERSDPEMTFLAAAGLTNETLDRALTAYLLTILSRHYSAFGVRESLVRPRLLCNKDPFTLRSMQRLLRLFPASRFLLLIRDGRAVADSIISGHVTIRGFDVTSHRGALADWNRATSTMFSQCMAVGVEHCLPVYYEQLVLNPRQQLTKVLRFIGVGWNDVVLRHETLVDQPEVYLSPKEFSSESVRRPINTDSLTKWAKHISYELRPDVRSIAPMLEMLGYDPDSYPPDYSSMNFRAESLLQQTAASRKIVS